MKMRIFILMGLAILGLLAVTLIGGTLSYSKTDGPLTAHQIAERRKPGTVMIYTVWKAHVVVPEAALDEPKMIQLRQHMLERIQQGTIQKTEKAVQEAAIIEVLTNFLDYVKPGKTMIEKDVETGAMGSGFIVTPDGYIVTNAHVVYAEEDYLKWQLTQTALKELIEKDVQDIIKEAGELDIEIPEEVMNAGIKNVSIYYQHFMQMDKVSSQIFTEMGVAVPGLQAMQRGFTSDLRKRGEPGTGKDVAIIKIEKNNLPTVPLGNDSTVTTGERIYVIGYPGVATFHPILAEESVIEPTLTSGLISARKTAKGGWETLQTDAAITHGNSGGPAFNEKGEVIGIATFASIDYERGAEVQGMNFLVPVNVAMQFLREINVTPQESQLSKLYEEGLVLYDQQQFKSAVEKFREVNELNPGYPYVAKYISDSRTAINEGRDRTTPTWMYVAAAVAAVFFILLVIAGVIAFVIYRIKSHKGPGIRPITPVARA